MIKKNDDGAFDFICDHDEGCGITDHGDSAHYPFASRGWPSEDFAKLRGEQHLAEHETGEPMQPVEEFRKEHNLFVQDNGVVVVRD